MRQSACLVINSFTMNSIAGLLNCFYFASLAEGLVHWVAFDDFRFDFQRQESQGVSTRSCRMRMFASSLYLSLTTLLTIRPDNDILPSVPRRYFYCAALYC